jgi:hypothetical protein
MSTTTTNRLDRIKEARRLMRANEECGADNTAVRA